MQLLSKATYGPKNTSKICKITQGKGDGFKGHTKVSVKLFCHPTMNIDEHNQFFTSGLKLRREP